MSGSTFDPAVNAGLLKVPGGSRREVAQAAGISNRQVSKSLRWATEVAQRNARAEEEITKVERQNPGQDVDPYEICRVVGLRSVRSLYYLDAWMRYQARRKCEARSK